MKTLLVCDRSGGHIFPALAFAKALEKEGEVCFFATSEVLKEYIEAQKYKVWGRCFGSRNIFWELLWRLGEAVYVILAVRPQRVIGFGGRDSFFLIFFSACVLIPTSIYEPNIVMGRANRVLSLFVRRVMRGFDGADKGGKACVVGVPLRNNIRRIARDEAVKRLGLGAGPVIFCFGGSQGSEFLNRNFINLVAAWDGEFQIIHLTGKNDYGGACEAYKRIGKTKFIKDFYYDAEYAYSAADLVISRAGASTLAEISYYGLPSILIPHPAAGGHQRANALYFQERGAARVFLQDNFNFTDFAACCRMLLFDEKARREMAGNISKVNLAVSCDEFGDNIARVL